MWGGDFFNQAVCLLHTWGDKKKKITKLCKHIFLGNFLSNLMIKSTFLMPTTTKIQTPLHPTRQKIKEPIIWDLQCCIEKEWEWRRQLLNSIDSFPNNICRRQTSLAFWWATEATDFVAKRSAREWRRCSARNISDENQVFSSSPLLSHLLSKDNWFNICVCMVKSVFYKEKSMSDHK